MCVLIFNTLTSIPAYSQIHKCLCRQVLTKVPMGMHFNMRQRCQIARCITFSLTHIYYFKINIYACTYVCVYVSHNFPFHSVFITCEIYLLFVAFNMTSSEIFKPPRLFSPAQQCFTHIQVITCLYGCYMKSAVAVGVYLLSIQRLSDVYYYFKLCEMFFGEICLYL